GILFSGAILLTILTTFINHQEINTQYVSSVRTGNSSKENSNDSKNKDRNNSSVGISIARQKKVSSFTTQLKKENAPIPFEVTEEKTTDYLPISAKNEDYKKNAIFSTGNLKANIELVNSSSPTQPISDIDPVVFDHLLQDHKSIEPKENIKDSHGSTQVNLNSFNNSRFYLGLAGGPLFSKIKSQGLKKPGFNMGLLVGYRISKKLSVETGLLYTKQYYFSGGKFYNTATGGNTASSMEGSRTAFEIPFKLNYYFLRNKSGGFYLSGGLSSFVGVNDKIIVNVGENPVHPLQKLDYGVASYLPSYLNIGFGYDHKFGRSTHLRIEPYLQIPLSSTAGNTININAGGTLQVYNAGLHLIISEFIH
ncbi:MAG TPA: hypothetical protein VK711_07965, partial [Puia sp.]|nr:hypothetical protein [Puia sp.]